ncbi:MAG: YaiI/YqxD family protein [Clostridia bacterium]|nr:YaiI/YqxD family protein [Clostridia bacterium]
MKILIDADGCPVVDISIEVAKEYDTECIILCDTAHFFERSGASTITVSKGADSVDFKIVNLLQKGDIVVTQDYGLAAMCLAKDAFAINQNGLIFDTHNIDSLLNSRYNAKKVRAAGGRIKGPSKRRPEQDKDFRESLCKLCKNHSR